MANERITENFFRKFVFNDKAYLNGRIICEEQISKDKKIDKLLSNASKSGCGKGYPEFILQFKNSPAFLIIVECKSNIIFRESANKDKYKNYAVDGALLYSSFLSKEYDVLSIAISGETEESLKISHYLQLKSTNEACHIFNDDKLLPLDDYLSGYKTDERKFNRDFQELLKYSKTLNDKLHTLKVPESNRSLLISGALIALTDKTFKPNVGFLNPPYKITKNNKEEFEFVLNNLSQLQKGSYCVAIVPISCALATSGGGYELKKRILKEHSLQAVFTMPSELFHNSKVNVSACIMVFKAYEKHHKDYKTYFGYWKDDGFTKRKASGRADYYNKWENIKKYWLANYRNKEEIAGHSIKQHVTAKNEWCVEVYMKTDYTVLTDSYFEKVILDYLSFLLVNFKTSLISSDKILDKKINLHIEKWSFISLNEIFKIKSGSGGNIYNLEVGGKYPYISSTSTNNGLINFVNADKEDLENGNTITINRTGSIGETFYQPYRYIASKDRVRVLMPKFQMNKYIGMFFISIIRLEKYRFNYSRTRGTNRIKTSKIKLPLDRIGKPDWEFMENYIKSLNYSSSL